MTSSVLVRFSIVKNKFYDETAFPKGTNPGTYKLGKHAAKMEGISVIRARREIDFRRFDTVLLSLSSVPPYILILVPPDHKAHNYPPLKTMDRWALHQPQPQDFHHFRRFDFYNVINEPQHRWWGCEIIFGPELSLVSINKINRIIDKSNTLFICWIFVS